MAALASFLVFTQALGAVGGVASVVIGELAYAKARQDGRIDKAEKAHLRSIVKGVQYGMVLILVSSIGLVLVSFMSGAQTQPALTVSYWVFMLLSLAVIIVSWMLSRKHVSFTFGSAVVFSAWWLIAYIAFGLMPMLSFGAAIAYFIFITALLYAMLYYVRFILARPLKPKTHS